MDFGFDSSESHMLRIWQMRQKADTRLLTALVLATLIPVVRFCVAPGAGSAWVLAIFLFAVVLACGRLLNSAAMVGRLAVVQGPSTRNALLPSEILDVYEKPAEMDILPIQSAKAFWLQSTRAAPPRRPAPLWADDLSRSRFPGSN